MVRMACLAEDEIDRSKLRPRPLSTTKTEDPSTADARAQADEGSCGSRNSEVGVPGNPSSDVWVTSLVAEQSSIT